MATYGKGFLGEATIRLARLLGIDGQIPLKLGETITPVVLVGDGTLPGYGAQELRRWKLYVDVPPAATSTNFAIKPQEDLLIESISWTAANASTQARVNFIGASGADPFAIATRKAMMMDRNPGTELAPLLHGVAGAVAITGTEVWRSIASSSAGQETDMKIAPFLLPKGARLFFWVNGAVGFGIDINGRTV